MKYVFVALLILAIIWTPVFADRPPEDDPAEYTLLKCVENSDVVAIGTVLTLTGVYRQNMPPNNQPLITTDILIRVETLIKGETNFGDNHIKMMVLGGTAFVPGKDEVRIHKVSPQPEFKVGEKALLFIDNNNDYTWFRNYPHNRYRLHRFEYGKRLIEEDNVIMRYPGNSIKMPIDLAKNLAKAFMDDKDGALRLERDIKTAAQSGKVLPANIATRLNASAKLLFEEDSK